MKQKILCWRITGEEIGSVNCNLWDKLHCGDQQKTNLSGLTQTGCISDSYYIPVRVPRSLTHVTSGHISWVKENNMTAFLYSE